MQLTPDDFERQVERLLRDSGVGLSEFRVQHREKVRAADGTYEIDVTARFEALGAKYLVLVECKHHRAPIKRELVQVLHDRVRAVAAQKGMMFATGTYQHGAVEYASKHGIALVTLADGRQSWHTRSIGPTMYPPWLPPYVGWVHSLTPDGSECRSLLDAGRPEGLLDAFQSVTE